MSDPRAPASLSRSSRRSDRLPLAAAPIGERLLWIGGLSVVGGVCAATVALLFSDVSRAGFRLARVPMRGGARALDLEATLWATLLVFPLCGLVLAFGLPLARRRAGAAFLGALIGAIVVGTLEWLAVTSGFAPGWWTWDGLGWFQRAGLVAACGAMGVAFTLPSGHVE